MDDAGQTAAGLADRNRGLEERLDKLLILMQQSVRLQQVALLEEGSILRFSYRGEDIALALPRARQDYLQGWILRNQRFYELAILEKVAALNLVGPKSLVCDVGANIGNHAVYFGRVMGAGRVMAFEPQPSVFRTLQQNLEINGMNRNDAHNVMVGPSAGTGKVAHFNPENIAGTSFVADAKGTVQMISLDDVLTAAEVSALDFVKIDVEGQHMPVLEGAKRIMRDRRPAIWVELLEKENAYPEAAAFMADLGYTPLRISLNDYLFKHDG